MPEAASMERTQDMTRHRGSRMLAAKHSGFSAVSCRMARTRRRNCVSTLVFRRQAPTLCRHTRSGTLPSWTHPCNQQHATCSVYRTRLHRP